MKSDFTSNEDGRHNDEVPLHGGKGEIFFCDIRIGGYFCLLQVILREFVFFTLSAVWAFL